MPLFAGINRSMSLSNKLGPIRHSALLIFLQQSARAGAAPALWSQE